LSQDNQNVLQQAVESSVTERGIAVMAHVIAGYPSLEANWEILEELDRAKVDVVEIQFPFSEPIADGPLFLEGNQQSLNNGTSVEDCFALIEKASKQFRFKVVMMGYYNTLFCYGEEAFCAKLQTSGAHGMIVPDLPVEEASELEVHATKYGQSIIRLIAPTNTEERITKLLHGAQGFVYAVARKGVTGSQTTFSSEIDRYLGSLYQNSPVPVGVGFGISSRQDIEHLKGKAHMAVIGTAALKTYIDNGKEGVRTFFEELLGYPET
jgi:tryptophan synthase alpha chain